MEQNFKMIEGKAIRHIKLRWVGAPFFLLGLVWLFTTLQSALQTGTWYPVMIGFASTMMGLTCFGLNHDTAIQMAMEVRQADPEYVFEGVLQREVMEEVERDHANALSLSGHPTLGMVLPVITLCVHALVVYLIWF